MEKAEKRNNEERRKDRRKGAREGEEEVRMKRLSEIIQYDVCSDRIAKLTYHLPPFSCPGSQHAREET